jgi:hypothetical protein
VSTIVSSGSSLVLYNWKENHSLELFPALTELICPAAYFNDKTLDSFIHERGTADQHVSLIGKASLTGLKNYHVFPSTGTYYLKPDPIPE